MVEIFQFIVYVVVATFDDATTVASYFAWLGPVREAALGLLLAGIVLALATIARALGSQFWRALRDHHRAAIPGAPDPGADAHPNQRFAIALLRCLGDTRPRRMSA